jgi:hypothetical protein
MSITAVFRAPLIRLCAAAVVLGPCNPVAAADVPHAPRGHECIRGGKFALLAAGFFR